MHHQFAFQNLKSVPYCMIRSGPDSILLVVGTTMTAWMPTHMREWLANTVAHRMDNPTSGRPLPVNVIDFTAARALRAPVITERKGEAHGTYTEEAAGRCPRTAERPLPGTVSGHR